MAESWELATVEAARFWGVPWGKVAALCECKRRIPGAPRNVCCRCGKVYYGPAPMCGVSYGRDYGGPLEPVRTETLDRMFDPVLPLHAVQVDWKTYLM